MWPERPIRQFPFLRFQPRSAPPQRTPQLLVPLLVYSGDWAHQRYPLFIHCLAFIAISVIQMKLCKSAIYKHFKLLPSILIKKGVVKYKFICKTNPYISFWKFSIDWLIFFLSNEDPVTCVCHNHSTSNLNLHIERCSGKLAPAAQHISKFAHRSTYNKAKFHYLITLWVSQCHHCYRWHLHQSRGRLGAWVSRGNQPLVAITSSVSTYLLLWLTILAPVTVWRRLPPSAPSTDVPVMSTYVCVFWTLPPPSVWRIVRLEDEVIMTSS